MEAGCLVKGYSRGDEWGNRAAQSINNYYDYAMLHWLSILLEAWLRVGGGTVKTNRMPTFPG